MPSVLVGLTVYAQPTNTQGLPPNWYQGKIKRFHPDTNQLEIKVDGNKFKVDASAFYLNEANELCLNDTVIPYWSSDPKPITRKVNTVLSEQAALALERIAQRGFSGNKTAALNYAILLADTKEPME